MRYLAWDLGRSGIRVNAVSAGPVRTLAARSLAGFTTMEEMFEQRAPLHRQIDAGDVGAAAAYLLSDDAANVTGTMLYVDAGYHAMGMRPGRPGPARGEQGLPWGRVTKRLSPVRIVPQRARRCLRWSRRRSARLERSRPTVPRS
jgi:hypothetical protein